MTGLVIKRVTFLFECMAGFICQSVDDSKKNFMMCLCIFVLASNKPMTFPPTLPALAFCQELALASLQEKAGDDEGAETVSSGMCGGSWGGG